MAWYVGCVQIVEELTESTTLWYRSLYCKVSGELSTLNKPEAWVPDSIESLYFIDKIPSKF